MSGIITRKFVSGILTVALAASLTSSAFAATSASESNGEPAKQGVHWAQDTLNKWESKKWIRGDEQGNLKPDVTVTRAEFASLVNRSFGFTANNEAAEFKDIKNTHWAFSEIGKALTAGYMKGYADQTIKPNASVSRQEAAVMIAGILKLETAAEADLPFKDKGEFASWGLDSIRAVFNASILKGYSDGTFKPNRPLTRAEAVVSLDRALNIFTTGTEYDKEGSFGPENGKVTVDGNVTISAPGVTLRNMHIKGNLLIAKSVGEGDVYLNNVTVDGTTTIQGGGEHSIHFENSVMVTVIIDKQSGAVRIVANGATVIQQVEVQSAAIVNTSGLTGNGITEVNLSNKLPKDSKVELVGTFETVNVLAQNIVVAIPEGTINNLTVDKSAASTEVNLSKEASIVALVLNAAAAVTGQGEVKKATVNSDGVKLEKAPAKIEMGADVSKDAKIKIGDSEKPVSEATTPAVVVPPSSGGSSNTTTPPPSITFSLGSDVTAANETDRQLNKLWLFFPDPVDSVEARDGIWEVQLRGNRYKIAVTNLNGNTPISISQAVKFDYDSKIAILTVNYPFTGRVHIQASLYTGSIDNPIATQSAKFPNHAIMRNVADNDRTLGLDGRDFTVNWVPSGTDGVIEQKVYVLPTEVPLSVANQTPVATFTDLSVSSWTGNASTLDSLGKPLQPHVYYALYVVEQFAEPSAHNSSALSILPIPDLNQDPNAPKPNQLILPSQDDPVPVVTASLTDVFPIDMSQGYVEATVGQSVYAMSNLEGFIYLLPSSITKTVPMMELAVEQGKGLRKAVTVSQSVYFDTSWMEDGSYNVIAISNKNAISADTTWNRVRLYADASTPLDLDSMSKTMPSYDISINFNKKILNALANEEALRAAIKIVDKQGVSHALTDNEVVTISKNSLNITMAQWASSDGFKISIAAGALKDEYGNLLEKAILSWEMEFGSTITITSAGTTYQVGQEIKVVTNKDAKVFLVKTGTSGTQATFEAEVVALRGKKIETTANVEAIIPTDGLPPGSYSIHAWGGESVSVTLTAP